MEAIKEKKSRFIATLGEGREALESVTEAVQTGTMTECVKQVFLQLDREMKRKGVERFGVGDITIVTPRKATP